jgi:hypothetical protein
MLRGGEIVNGAVYNEGKIFSTLAGKPNENDISAGVAEKNSRKRLLWNRYAQAAAWSDAIRGHRGIRWMGGLRAWKIPRGKTTRIARPGRSSPPFLRQWLDPWSRWLQSIAYPIGWHAEVVGGDGRSGSFYTCGE